MPASHINNLADGRKVVTGQNCIIHGQSHPGHRIIESFRVFRILFKEFPDRHTEGAIKGDLASLQAMQQLAPCRIMLFS